MPLGTYLVNKILKDLKNARREQKAPGLEPDAKAQITLLCEGRKAVKTATLLVSCQHQEKLTPEDVREIILEQLKASLPEEFIPAPQNILTNPAGRFIIGGPDGDTGLTGRKIIADTYGGYAPHGAEPFPAKTPPRWTGRQLTCFATWPKISSPPGWPENVCSRFPTPSDAACLCRCTSTAKEPAKLTKTNSWKQSEKWSTSHRQASSTIWDCANRYIPQPQPMDTLADKPFPTANFHGKN